MTEGPFSIERRPDGVAVLWLDVPGQSMNTLGADFDREIQAALDAIEKEQSLRAVVLASGKPESFIAGADIAVLRSVRNAGEATALSRRAQAAVLHVETFRVPVVAAIHGACLGGGLELALACRRRVASDDARTELGLPEVKLGVIPGAGGTQRLPRLIGPEAALDLILTGKSVPARKARSLGLVDEVVPRPILLRVAVDLALRAAGGSDPVPAARRTHPRSLVGRVRELVLEDNPIGRVVLWSEARRGVLAKTAGNYPAPLRAIEAVRTGIEDGPEAGYRAEAEEFGALAVSLQARNLMGLFFATNELKKDPGTEDPKVRAKPVRKVGVLGSGLMGSGIAYVTVARAGLPVRLKDVGPEPLRRALQAIRKPLDERVARKRLEPRERDRVMARVGPTTDYRGFGRVDVVIEAVIEDLAVKQNVLREVEGCIPKEAVFASNTSSIPIDRIADAARRPERVVGLHYFSPVDQVPLLEVIAGPRTAPDAVATGVALGKAQGKTVIVVRDGPGFYTTRILAPYVNEAGHLLGEGVPIEEIDAALVKFGFPVGPLKLLDEVGIDVGHKISHILREAFGERMRPSTALEEVFRAGRLGRKNRKGFYLYAAGGSGNRRPDTSVYGLLGIEPRPQAVKPEEVAERCVLAMVNEALRCREEGILRSERDGNVGAVMGLGFPPFLGGPFRYLEEQGRGRLVEKLEGLRARHGLRFEPARALVKA
jgi:3-hydroxyacyl-CoA dehydrogenase/enoyl-CoA hydratase/3-hydroxybutyryl-CoA epimerase